MSVASRPSQFLILPDPAFTATTISSVTSEDGAYIGHPVPEATNLGDLVPFASGAPTVDPTSVDIRVHAAGGLHQATWSWRESPSGQRLGQCDARRWHAFQNLWTTDSDLNGVSGFNCDVAFSSVYNRLLVFRRRDDGIVDVRYKSDFDVDTATTLTWSQLDITEARFSTGTYDDPALGCVAMELPDGTMLMALNYIEFNPDYEIGDADNVSAVTDFDLYSSVDGGLTWSRIAEEIIRANGLHAALRDGRPRGDVSGDFIRIGQVEAAGGAAQAQTITTYTSADRGGTWSEHVLSLPMAANTGGRYPWAIVGLEDGSGGFLLAQKDGSGLSVRIYFTSGTDEWQDVSGDEDLVGDGLFGTLFMYPTNVNPTSYIGVEITDLFFAKDESRIYLYATYADTGSAPSLYKRILFRSVPRENATDPTAWSVIQGDDDGVADAGIPFDMGAMRFQPAEVRSVWAGDRIVFVSGFSDHADQSAAESQAMVWQQYGWDARAFQYDRGGVGIPGTSIRSVYEAEWFAWMGIPAGAGSGSAGGTVSADTSYTATSAGTTSLTFDFDALKIQTSVTTGMHTYARDTGTSPTNYYADGSMFEWTNQCWQAPTGGRCIFHLRALGSDSEKVDVSVYHSALSGTTQAVLFDNDAVATLATVAATFHDRGYYDWRLALRRPAPGTVELQLMYRQTGTITWNETAVFEPSVTGAFTNQSYLWGNTTGPTAGVTSSWREVRVAPRSYDQVNYDEDVHLAGKPCAPYPVLVRNGVSVFWGGGAAFIDDEYTYENEHTLGAENLFLPSPQNRWQAATANAQVAIFDAGATGRFVHDALAFVGARAQTIHVEYSDNNFSTISAGVTLDFLRSSATSAVQALSGNAMTAMQTFTDRFVSGSLVGCYAAKAGTTTAMQIDQQLGNVLVAEDATTTLAGSGFAVSDVVRVYSPNAAILLSSRVVARYMRWTVSAAMGGANIDMKDVIGSAVAGITLPVRVPFDWIHDDAETPNVLVEEAPNGQRWSVKQGPPRRAITARIVGDVDGYREEFRNLVSSLADYSVRPMVLVLDDTKLTRPNNVFYCTFDGATQLEQQVWYTDTNNELQRGGDLSVAFSEEV